jgi:hypothetical protein
MKRSLIGKLKDAALEKTLLSFARPKFERYGEIRQLSINTTAKLVSGEVLLLGDTSPVVVSQARYRIDGTGDDARLTLYDVKVSRQWAQNLMDDHFPEIGFKIPPFVSSII